jgi:VIT1/CCC1 family predicted Fe2+/Mn2+ transporter
MDKWFDYTSKQREELEIERGIYKYSGINLVGVVLALIATVTLFTGLRGAFTNRWILGVVDELSNGYYKSCVVTSINSSGNAELQFDDDTDDMSFKVANPKAVVKYKQDALMLDSNKNPVILKSEINYTSRVILKSFLLVAIGALIVLLLVFNGSDSFKNYKLVGMVDKNGESHYFTESDTVQEKADKGSEEK